MTANNRSTVVGVFEDRRKADQAVIDLKQAGFTDSQIGVAMRHDAAAEAGTTDESYAAEGATTGALTGLGLGALAGLGVLSGVIPVIGPAIAGGTLGILFSNAMAGAAVAGLTGALVGAGIPEEEAGYYHNEFESGRTIVTVNAGSRCDEAKAILRNAGGYDMSSRATATADAPAAASTPTAYAAGTSTHKAGDTIEVKEERLVAHKQPVKTGEVTVRKEVHTETRNIEVPVQREEVVIERTPVQGRTPTSGVGVGKSEEIRIPVSEEQVNVSKEAVVKEEVKVGKRVVQDTERVTGQVRKEDVRVEQKGDVDVNTRGSGKTNPKI